MSGKEHLDLEDLLRAAELSGATLELRTDSTRGRGRMVVMDGKLLYANLSGEQPEVGREAVDAMLAADTNVSVAPVSGAIARNIDPDDSVEPAQSSPPLEPAPQEPDMSENPFQAVVDRLKNSVPGAMATGIFSIRDGLMLAVNSSVPDTNMDAMSGSHVRIVDQMNKFVGYLPERISGRLQSSVLVLEDATFYMAMDEEGDFALMIACEAGKGSLGFMRLMARKQMGLVRELMTA